jgi:hypothetical protein
VNGLACEALVRAADKGWAASTALLIDKGSNVNYASGRAIRRASAKGNLPIVQMLVEAKADVNMKSPFVCASLSLSSRHTLYCFLSLMMFMGYRRSIHHFIWQHRVAQYH